MTTRTAHTRAGIRQDGAGTSGATRLNGAATLAAHWLGLALAASAPALARSDGAGNEPLGGPKVVDRGPPGDRAFGTPQTGRGIGGTGTFARPGATHAAFLRAVHGLEGDLAVSEEQRETIMAIEQEFRAAMRAFREAHQDEIRAIRAKAGMGEGMGPGAGPGRDGEGRGRGGPTGKVAADLTPEQRQARARLGALMERAPKADEFRTRQWAVLSLEQQNAVRAAMDALRDAAPRERMRRGGPGAEGRPEGARPRDGRGRAGGPEFGPGGFRPEGFGPGGRGPGGEAREEGMRRGGPPARRGGPGPGPRAGPQRGAGGAEDRVMPPPPAPEEKGAAKDDAE